MTFSQAQILAQAVYLLNQTPRFSPRDRRMHFDSYSTAADLTSMLRASGYEPDHPSLLPRD
jgi:hypothetical protein